MITDGLITYLYYGVFVEIDYFLTFIIFFSIFASYAGVFCPKMAELGSYPGDKSLPKSGASTDSNPILSIGRVSLFYIYVGFRKGDLTGDS